MIIAETGADMSRFPTPGHLSSWAGLCPGNNESAGKRLSGRTRNGNACLQRRRGRKRATVAVSRTILESAWWLMSNNVDYHDLGPEHFLSRTTNPARRAHRLLLELRALGYDLTLTTPVPAASPG